MKTTPIHQQIVQTSHLEPEREWGDESPPPSLVQEVFPALGKRVGLAGGRGALHVALLPSWSLPVQLRDGTVADLENAAGDDP